MLAFLAFFSVLSPGIEAILCYKCDALVSQKSNCPGWQRRPVDSLSDISDRGDLYSHCVDVRLANGTVLYQYPTCVTDFLALWREQLEKKYKQDVNVSCCKWDLCNGWTGATTSNGPQCHFVLHLIVPLIIGIDGKFTSFWF